MNSSATPVCTLTYNKGDLGDEVFTFSTEQEAHSFLHKGNPMDLLVRSAYLDVDGMRHIIDNPFFWPAGYDFAVSEKQWKDEFYRRTGRQWDGDDGGGGCSSSGGGNDEGDDLDYSACLRLLGLKPGFTWKELARAYRIAVRMNHPDFVATMAEEFKALAERRTSRINQAYMKLKCSGHSG